MELQLGTTYSIGDIIVYKCRGKWTQARVTKLNKKSIRIEDGVVADDGSFTASDVPNTTNKGSLQLNSRRIYTYVMRDTVAETRDVIDQVPPKTARKTVISIHHPSQGSLDNSWRIGDYSRILASGRQAGCSGYKPETVIEALQKWSSDGKRYNKMKFSDTNTTKVLRFIKDSENPGDFQPLVIGKETESDVGKAAFVYIPTGNIILRTATKGTPTRKAYQSHKKRWMVETSLFNADKSFWKRLARVMVDDSEISMDSPRPLVDYDSE
mgnify:CR=1 FL=1